jgi:hypothetical protein
MGANRIEHRWGVRVRVNIPVKVSARASAGVDGCLKNVSLSGALIKADCELPLHTLIEITIKLSPSLHVIKAHVSRKLNEEVGIEWCEFAPRAVKELLRSARIGSPALAPAPSPAPSANQTRPHSL